MKKSLSLLLIFILSTVLSGCITSTSPPAGGDCVIIELGNSQTFTITDAAGTHVNIVWYLDGEVVKSGGPEARSYEFIPEDIGEYTITVTAASSILKFVKDSRTWCVEVVDQTPADLEPISVDVSEVLIDCETFELDETVKVVIRNNGTTDVTEAYKLTIFEDINEDGVYQDTDKELGNTTVTSGPLGADTIDVVVEVTGNLQSGDTLIYAYVDSDYDIPETNEDNNILSEVFDRCPTGCISSTFDIDTDDWASNTTGVFNHSTTDGNPGGYANFEDKTGDAAFIFAPAIFLGDWSDYNNVGYISYEHKIFKKGESWFDEYKPYTIIISGPGGEATWNRDLCDNMSDKNCIPEPTEWIPNTAILTGVEADGWTINSGSWSVLLENVTELKIRIEQVDGQYDEAGIDNVQLCY